MPSITCFYVVSAELVKQLDKIILVDPFQLKYSMLCCAVLCYAMLFWLDIIHRGPWDTPQKSPLFSEIELYLFSNSAAIAVLTKEKIFTEIFQERSYWEFFQSLFPALSICFLFLLPHSHTTLVEIRSWHVQMHNWAPTCKVYCKLKLPPAYKKSR